MSSIARSLFLGKNLHFYIFYVSDIFFTYWGSPHNYIFKWIMLLLKKDWEFLDFNDSLCIVMPILFFFFLEIGVYLFIYFWLCWVFVSVLGLSLVAANGGHSSSWCMGLSLSRTLFLRSTGSRRAGSVIVAHGPSCSAACGIFPDQGSNPCPLHGQADFQPLSYQGRPNSHF